MALRSEIDEVRTRTDIVDIIQQFTSLKKAGKDYRGLCPFHSEKTPSFHVYPDMARWRCFGQCGVGGDVFEFLQKIEGLTFPEALERLANRAGVTLSQNTGVATLRPGESSERDRVLRVNQLAIGYYSQRLRGNDRAQTYLTTRGMNANVQQQFALGYATDAWDGLSNYLRQNGASLVDAELAGLVGKRDSGGMYDRIRDRVVFPIFDVQNRPIAFGARLLGPPTENQPKYWNSPETPVFTKSKTLYGLATGRKAIAAADTAIVVEGYTDVIACQSAGFGNAVATLGTSLTEEHVKVLRRLASTVLLCFDADSAGMRAAFRAAELFERHDMSVKVIEMPAGQDPDSLIHEGHSDQLQTAIANAFPLIEFQLKQQAKSADLTSEQGRLELLQKSMMLVSSVGSEIERDRYVGMIARYHPRYRNGSAAVEDQIRRELAALVRANRRAQAPGRSQEPVHTPRPIIALQVDADQRAEMHILRALLSEEPELVNLALSEVEPTDFVTECGRKTAAYLRERLNSGADGTRQSILSSVTDSDLADVIGALLVEEEPIDEDVIRADIAHLKSSSLETEAALLKSTIDAGDADAAMLQRYTALIRMLKGQNQSVGGTRGK